MDNFLASVFSFFQSEIVLADLLMFSQALFISLLAGVVGFCLMRTEQLQKAEIFEKSKTYRDR